VSTAGTRSFQFQVKLAAGDSPEPSLQTFQKVLDARTVSACGYMTPSGCRCSAPICGWWTATGSAACCWPMTSRTCIPGGRPEHEHRHPGRLQPGLEAGLGARREPEWLLGTYEEEWLPVAAWALGISSRRHRELLGDTAAGGAAAPLAEELRQLGIGYVGGALARDIPHPTGRVRAGDRAPDASAATPRAPWYGSTSSAARTARCWPSARVMRTSSCELHGRASRCRGPAGRVGGERDLVDVDGHAHRAYDLDGDALVLVRPDGYIGLLAGPAPRRRSTRVPRPAHRRGGSASLTPGGPPIHDCGWQVSQDCC
jgi:hypothetical protein